MKKLVLALGAVGLVSGCSSVPMNDNDVGIMERPPEVLDKPAEETQVQIGKLNVPSWFLEVPEDQPDRIYAVGTALSDDMQFAFDKAVHEAKVNLGDKIASRSSAEVKTFISDSGKGGLGQTTKKSEKVSKSGFSGIDVSKYTVEHRAVFEERRYFRTYVQVSIDPNDRFEGEIINTYDPQDEIIADKALNDL